MELRIEEKTRFDIIRYSNCWEDADVLLTALGIKEGGTYISIASCGDNTFSILTQNPSLVLAVDISPAQLACVELRKFVFINLSYEQMLQFLGVNPTSNRMDIYNKIRNNLSIESRRFWDTHIGFIKKGIIHVGKFEGYFRLFREKVLPLVHNKKKVMELLKAKDESKRVVFYNKIWNTWRWRLLFKIFFSRTIMGHLGRDPEFFKYVQADVPGQIMQRAKYALTSLPTDNNPYLEYILTGNFKNSLPFYLRKENFDIIRKNLDKLVLFKGNLSEAFQSYRTLKFDGFNLSDIFEYMSYNQYVAELKRIIESSKKGARLVYWNMLVDRKSPESLKNHITSLEEYAQELFLQNKAFFYKSLIIEEIK